ncbi:MAG TPA: hypothetical protein VFI91_07385 [Longimicrobiaceae bacterium]|nr:hypothetical protein [Longimicrobiaceae bacterium]
MLLLLVLLGTVGLGAELFLLEHTETIWQWIPLIVLGCGFFSGLTVAFAPRRSTVLIYRGVMVVFVAAGVLGLYLHFEGNAAFELEMDESLQGIGLFWKSMRGATPALAPGAMAQLGLLGLIQAYRHPALLNSARRDS